MSQVYFVFVFVFVFCTRPGRASASYRSACVCQTHDDVTTRVASLRFRFQERRVRNPTRATTDTCSVRSRLHIVRRLPRRQKRTCGFDLCHKYISYLYLYCTCERTSTDYPECICHIRPAFKCNLKGPTPLQCRIASDAGAWGACRRARAAVCEETYAGRLHRLTTDSYRAVEWGVCVV